MSKMETAGVEVIGYQIFITKEEFEEIRRTFENNNTTGSNFWLGFIYAKAMPQFVTNKENVEVIE